MKRRWIRRPPPDPGGLARFSVSAPGWDRAAAPANQIPLVRMSGIGGPKSSAGDAINPNIINILGVSVRAGIEQLTREFRFPFRYPNTFHALLLHQRLQCSQSLLY